MLVVACVRVAEAEPYMRNMHNMHMEPTCGQLRDTADRIMDVLLEIGGIFRCERRVTRL